MAKTISDNHFQLPHIKNVNLNNLTPFLDKVVINYTDLILVARNKRFYDDYVNELSRGGFFQQSSNSTRVQRINGSKWLIQSDKVYFTNFKNAGGIVYKKFNLKTTLNFSRIYNNNSFLSLITNQSPKRLESVLTAQDLDAGRMFRRNENRLKQVRNITLDQNDNFIRETHYLRAKPLRNRVEFILNKSRELIEAKFAMQASLRTIAYKRQQTLLKHHITLLDDGWLETNSDVPENFSPMVICNWDEASVYDLEVYFEFKIENAIKYVKDLNDYFFKKYCDKVKSKTVLKSQKGLYEGYKWQSDTVLNSFITYPTYDITKNVKLVIYAKSWERVRFEFRYNNKSFSVARRQRKSIAGVNNYILTCTEDAKERFKRLYNEISNTDMTDRKPPVYPLQAKHILNTFLDVPLPSIYAQRLIQLLAENGSIRAKDNPDLVEACDYLLKKRMLKIIKPKKRNDTKIYTYHDNQIKTFIERNFK